MPIGADCKCPSGTYFDGMDCISGTLNCLLALTDPVCSCDENDFLNNCIARANGYKKFTKGGCGFNSKLNCSSDPECPIGTCSDGKLYKNFTCTDGLCKLVAFSDDPCSSSSGGGFSSSIIHTIDLTNNSVGKISPLLKDKVEGISAVDFIDDVGSRLIAGSNDTESTKFFVIDRKTGKIERNFSAPGIAKSIEPSPNFRKAVVTFKDELVQSVGILVPKARELIKFDIPVSIIFQTDEILSMIDFDLLGNKATASSFFGKHILYLLNLIDNKLTIKFLSNEIEGQTQSTINPDGTISISVANIDNPDQRSGITVYKLNVSNVRSPKSLQTITLEGSSKVLDVKITPDNNKVLILVQDGNEKRLKILSLEDLSLLCDFKVSDDLSNTFLTSDPYGRYTLTPNFEDKSISLISNIQVGPVLKKISPNKGPKQGGTQFTIDGFIDPSIFTDNVKVCFGNSTFCATSTKVTNSGRTITGVTPKFPKSGFTHIILTAEKKTGVSESSGSIKCSGKVGSQTTYKKVFRFE